MPRPRSSHNGFLVLLGVATLGALCWNSVGPKAGFVAPRGFGADQDDGQRFVQAVVVGAGASEPSTIATATASGSLLHGTSASAAFGLGLAAVLAASRAAVRHKARSARLSATSRRAGDGGRQLRPRDRTDGHGWIKEDPEFVDTDASLVVGTHTVELKKRPSGITRYTHGLDGKGAMVMDMKEKARYPGDPLGQAAVAGVKKGYVVKSVAGTDVRGWDFEDIMDLLEDFIPDPDVQSTAAFKRGAGRQRKHEKVEFPVAIEYMELKEGAARAAATKAPKIPEGAWMPRMSGWDDADLAAERTRVQAMGEPGAGYAGPRYSDPSCISDAWLKHLINFQEKGGNLPAKDAYLLLLDTIKRLRSEKSLMDIEVKSGQTLTVFGDLHGQYFDFVNMLGKAGLPSPDRPFLFNGDFVDRGSWSIEVATVLYAFKLRNPDSVFFNRGNHEMLETNIIYGFAGECGAKYDMGLFDLFSESFRNLPLVHVVNKEVMVVHAGIPGPMPRVWLPGQTHDPEDAVPMNLRARTLAEIAAVDRYTELTANAFKAAVDDSPREEEKWETDQRMMIDFLWADPRGSSGYGPSYRKSRGVFMFGPDVTKQFCEENKLKLIIRSHEVKADGFKRDHDQLMSVFSAPNYLDTGGNSGAFLQLSPTGVGGAMEVTPTTFRAVPHPDLAPMHYQQFIVENHPHLTRQMKKKTVAAGADDFGDSDFAGFQGPDEWEEVEEDEAVRA